MPERVGVATLDGKLLTNADGSPVTAPFGDRARGTISDADAAAQGAAVEEMQRLDACRRGVRVPVSAEVTGSDLTLEQAAAKASAALAKAIAANGGALTKAAC